MCALFLVACLQPAVARTVSGDFFDTRIFCPKTPGKKVP